MLTKSLLPATLTAVLMAVGAISCQPQRADRAVRGSIDIKRDDAGVGAGGAGGGFDADVPENSGGAGGASPGNGTGGAAGPRDAAETAPAAPDAIGKADAVSDAKADGGKVDVPVGTPSLDASSDGARDGNGSVNVDGPLSADDLVASILAMTPQTCTTKVAGDFDVDVAAGSPPGKAAICGIKGALYWVADMNIDCDGRDVGGVKCPAGHGTDTFVHNASGQALAASVTPFVVIPYSAANPDVPAVDVKPGAVVAVISHTTRKIVFAIFGDTESATRIGAASYACAEQLGLDPNPMVGGQRGHNVTYVAFTDPTAVPKNIENQVEVSQLGQMLAAKFILDNKTGP